MAGFLICTFCFNLRIENIYFSNLSLFYFRESENFILLNIIFNENIINHNQILISNLKIENFTIESNSIDSYNSFFNIILTQFISKFIINNLIFKNSIISKNFYYFKELINIECKYKNRYGSLVENLTLINNYIGYKNKNKKNIHLYLRSYIY